MYYSNIYRYKSNLFLNKSDDTNLVRLKHFTGLLVTKIMYGSVTEKLQRLKTIVFCKIWLLNSYTLNNKKPFML